MQKLILIIIILGCVSCAPQGKKEISAVFVNGCGAETEKAFVDWMTKKIQEECKP